MNSENQKQRNREREARDPDGRVRNGSRDRLVGEESEAAEKSRRDEGQEKEKEMEEGVCRKAVKRVRQAQARLRKAEWPTRRACPSIPFPA